MGAGYVCACAVGCWSLVIKCHARGGAFEKSRSFCSSGVQCKELVLCPTRPGRDEVVADHQTVYACVSPPLSCKMIIGPYQSRILHGVGTVGISKVFERPYLSETARLITVRRNKMHTFSAPCRKARSCSQLKIAIVWLCLIS